METTLNTQGHCGAHGQVKLELQDSILSLEGPVAALAGMWPLASMGRTAPCFLSHQDRSERRTSLMEDSSETWALQLPPPPGKSLHASLPQFPQL